MADLGDLALAGFLIMFGAFSFIAIQNSSLNIGNQFADTDSFPGNDTWSFYGTLNGSIESENGDLQLSSSTETGQFISNRFTYQDRISIDRLVVETERPGGSPEDANITLRAYNDQNVLVEEQEYLLGVGRTSYDVNQFNGAVDAPDYDTYQFTVEIYDPDTQHIEVEDVVVDYTRYEEANIPFLAELVALLFFTAAIAKLFR